ncbi:MAG: hypothetical protein AB1558_00275 [Thermodesulfobacteriota bacterium]
MSFWEKGYPALFITSFHKNPRMHTASDTLDRLDRAFFLRVARALVGLMTDLARE